MERYKPGSGERGSYDSAPELMLATSPVDDRLDSIVLRYQQTYAAWCETADPTTRAELQHLLVDVHEQLWAQLAQPLLRRARCTFSHAIQDMLANPSYPTIQDPYESLAKSMYLDVVEALPRLKVDVEKNLLACLLRIAERRTLDQNKAIYQKYRYSPLAPQPDPETAAMWPELSTRTHYHQDAEHVFDQADPESYDAQDQLIEQLYRQACWLEIQEFRNSEDSLDAVDRQILDIRWAASPPTEFAKIAQRLGPGWTAAAVRQRHHRIIRKFRDHLKQRGLLDQDELRYDSS